MRLSFDRSALSWSYSILLLLTMLQAACERPRQSSELDAYVSREDDRWPQDVIPVCFEQALGFEQDRAIIQQIVSSEFGRADIQFSGWNLCQNEDRGIRISFDENAGMSQTKDIGIKNAGLNQNLVMGLKSRCAGVFSESVCERNLALHEFGHALGLRHEMNRRDNTTCGHDQMSGEGEDALQLGTYDKRSIMDYCFLYAANARLEALHLSEQDVAALKAVKSGLIASLDRSVPMVLQEPWTAYVQRPGLHSYRFALGPKDELACDQLSLYSESLSLDQPIQIDPRTIHTEPATVWTLCLLGENAAGQRQDLNVYSAIDFRILRPTEVTSTPPSLIQHPILYQKGQQIIMEIEIGSGFPLRSLHASLAYTQSTLYRQISNVRQESKDLGSGRYQLFFNIEDFPANGEVYVSTLELTNIVGDKLSIFSSAAWVPFYNQPWTSPAFTINGTYDNDLQGPSLIQISSFPEELDAGAKASFTMEIAENSRLQSIRMALKSDSSTLESVLQWQWLYGETYRIDLEIPPLAVNGHYRVESLGLEDVMNNRSDSSLDMTLIVKNGIPYESRPPQLISFHFSGLQYKRHEKAYVDLDIRDDSSIKQVNLILRHVSDQGLYKTLFGIDLGEISGKRRIELNTDRHHPQGSYAIQEISIVDRFGNTARYEVDPHHPGFLTGGLPIGTIELVEP
jgi:hypothetical protein